MKPRRTEPADKGPFRIIEETVHMLRGAPARVLASYCIGTMPFIAGLLYFWTDMSTSAFAHDRLAGGALIMAVLFVWMKTWHTVYATQLWTELRGDTGDRWTARRVIGVAVRQIAVQSTGLFLLPLVMIAVLPFAWGYAFYQNVTVLDNGSRTNLRELVHDAGVLAGLWHRQNTIIIWALSPYLMTLAMAFYLVMLPIANYATGQWATPFLGLYGVMFAVVVVVLSPLGVVLVVNISTMLLMLPQLLLMLLGINTTFVESPMAMLNSTFFAVVCAVAYLCMDPLVKAAYVIRCFYGESVRSGEDIRVELKRLARTACVGLLLAGVASGPAFAQDMEVPTSADRSTEFRQGVIGQSTLDRALDTELQDRRYAWRMPREKRSESEEGFMLRVLRSVGETVGGFMRVAAWALRRVVNWVRDWVPSPTMGDGGSLSSLGAGLRIVLYILLTALLCLVAISLWRAWNRRGGRTGEVTAERVDAGPELEDEGTTADELPEEGWLSMARELAERGELRLALRAVFLATLAFLGDSELIQIARFKSNRDYARELERRAHARPEVLDMFARSAGVYESVWYGTHAATSAVFERAVKDQERLKSLE